MRHFGRLVCPLHSIAHRRPRGIRFFSRKVVWFGGRLMCSSRVKYMSADTKLHLNKDDKKNAFTQQLSRNLLNLYKFKVLP